MSRLLLVDLLRNNLMSLKDLINRVDKVDKLPIDSDFITSFVIEREYCDEVYFHYPDMDHTLVRGFLNLVSKSSIVDPARSAKVAEIFISQGNNRCWERYTSAKELLHLVDPPGYNVNSLDKLDSLMIGLTSPLDQSFFSTGVISDVWAEYSSLLTLVPPRLRNMALGKRKDGTIDDETIAHLFAVPQKLVPLIMSDAYEALLKIAMG